jgi:hypothetical protein
MTGARSGADVTLAAGVDVDNGEGLTGNDGGAVAGLRLHLAIRPTPGVMSPTTRLVAVRAMLAEAGWCLPAIERTADGAPRLAGGSGGRADVSWSRSGQWLAVAATDQGPLGVDLELPDGRRPPVRELRLVLRHGDIRLPGAGCDAWCRWTAVEALAKATRAGLHGIMTGAVRLRMAVPEGSIGSAVTGPDSGATDPVMRVRSEQPGQALSGRVWQVRHRHVAAARISVATANGAVAEEFVVVGTPTGSGREGGSA